LKSTLHLLVLALGGQLANCSFVTSFDGFGGGVPADGGTLGTGPSGPGFCESHATQTTTFCADFDEGSPTTAWIRGVRQANAVADENGASISMSTSVSAPGSLQAVPAGQYMFSDLELNVPYAGPIRMHAELDVYPDNADAMPIVEIDFCSGACNGHPPYDFEVLLNQNGDACIGEQGNGCTASLVKPGALPLQQWSHVTLDADMITAAVTLTAGAIPPINGTLSFAPAGGTTNLVFAIGLPSMTTGAVHVDNVLFSVL
jgi:hypothetical protein